MDNSLTTITFSITDSEGNITQLTRIHEEGSEYFDASIEAQIIQFRHFLMAQGHSKSTIDEFIADPEV